MGAWKASGTYHPGKHHPLEIPPRQIVAIGFRIAHDNPQPACTPRAAAALPYLEAQGQVVECGGGGGVVAPEHRLGEGQVGAQEALGGLGAGACRQAGGTL